MWKLLGLSILCLLLAGCPKPCPEPEIVIRHVYHYTKCPVDVTPVYKPLDEKAHLGSAYNANILIDDVAIMRDYIGSLQSSIDCYEKQVKE